MGDLTDRKFSLAGSVVPGYSLNFIDRDGVRYVSASGEFDFGNADGFEAFINAARDAGKPLVIDLSATDYIDSAILTVLVRQKKRAGSAIRIIVPKGARVRRIFEMTGLDRLLGVEHSLAPLRVV